MIVVNASNIAPAWEHIVAHKGGANVRLKDLSDEVGLLAVQGPGTEAAAPAAHRDPARGHRLLPLRRWARSPGRSASSPAPATPARTASSSTAASATPSRSGRRSPRPAPSRSASAPAIRSGWRWATRSTATRSTTPPRRSRPGSGWIVKLDKGAPFTGDNALRAQKQHGITRRLVGFRLEGRGFPRHGYPVQAEGREVDIVRSGTMSPSLGAGIGTTYLPVGGRQGGDEVRGRLPRREAAGGSGEAAVLDQGKCTEGSLAAPTHFLRFSLCQRRQTQKTQRWWWKFDESRDPHHLRCRSPW